MLLTLLIIVALIFSLLAIPLELKLRVDWPSKTAAIAELNWAFGLVRTTFGNVSGYGKRRSATTPPSNNSALPGRSGKSREKADHAGILNAIRNRPFRQRIVQFILDIWHSVQKGDVRLHMCVGLGDPATTGQLWSILGPASALLMNIRHASIRIEPDFSQQVLLIDFGGRFRLVPLRLFGLLAGLIVSPAIWRGYREMYART